MKRTARVSLLLSALLVPAFSTAQVRAGAGAPVVYFSLFGPDESALQRFYRAVFAWEVADNGDVATTVTRAQPVWLLYDEWRGRHSARAAAQALGTRTALMDR